jgi:hypothetical protein
VRACDVGTVCSETSAYKFQTLGNYPKQSIQHLEHGESLKSSLLILLQMVYISYIHTGVPGGMCQTSGGCSLC